MTATILITGFGPFLGAPYNPTGPLVSELARRRHPAFANVRRVAHVFPVSYEAVDRELPALLKRERPDALIMFGLAVRARQMRIEMRARNAVTRMLPGCERTNPARRYHPARGTPDRPIAQPRAAALVCGAGDRCAGRTFARRRPLPLQLFVLAGGRGCRHRDAKPYRIRPRAGGAARIEPVTAGVFFAP